VLEFIDEIYGAALSATASPECLSRFLDSFGAEDTKPRSHDAFAATPAIKGS
jgi:hypothetical protein